GKSYHGTATWFKPASEGGSEGACSGEEEDDDSNIVALNADQYGGDSKSSWCGKKVSIKGPKGETTARITDECPDCDEGDLDLTPAVFKKVVGDMDIGEADISWHVV
ncbi:RlpA-like double-psi beta-barrel-protein domain-containing protein-containing protein, partial [Radiomyces spectabilis]|uniref:RlpA-like double-psi beta-barrel-protein domain-containing protein-containing protein n=1 Tax=Radiomyces spectabilis TaxID=64574 RepID=UPI002220D423